MTFDRRLNDDRVDRYDEMERKMSAPVEQVRWEWDGKNFIRHTEIIEPVKPPQPDFSIYEYKHVTGLTSSFERIMNTLGANGWMMQHYSDNPSERGYSSTFTAVVYRTYKQKS